MVSLAHKVAVTVPSTSNVNTNIKRSEHKQRAAYIAEKLAQLYGGATVSDVMSGYWISDSKGLVAESVIKVEAYCEEAARLALFRLVAMAAKNWGQEAIMLEVDGKAYFVESN
jgi:hypothetical protein